jgi:hypothetical protein
MRHRSNEYYTKNAHRIVDYLQGLSPAVYGTMTRSKKGHYRAGALDKEEEVAIVASLMSAYPELLGYICARLDMSRGERAANGKGRPLIADSRMFGHFLFPDGFPKVKKTKAKAQPQPQPQPQPQAETATERKVPRGFVLLDNGGQSRDRYTILETVSRPLSSRGGGNFHPFMRFSTDPYSSYGKMSYGELNETAFQDVKSGGYAYFGKRINLSDLVGSGADMAALAYIEDSAAESKSDRAASKRRSNPGRPAALDYDDFIAGRIGSALFVACKVGLRGTDGEIVYPFMLSHIFTTDANKGRLGEDDVRFFEGYEMARILSNIAKDPRCSVPPLSLFSRSTFDEFVALCEKMLRE